jgi:hypothetical protein
MNEPAQRETPRVGIFWVAQASNGDARLFSAGCPYADRKLLTPATIARIKTQFHLPERTEVQSDLHYQSTEMPNVL